MTCRCVPTAEKLRRTLEPNCIQPKSCQPCQPCRPCSPIRQQCNCCCRKKPVGKGKFGLAYIIETSRRRFTQPLGWEVEFEDTPSNISYKCTKMANWANKPPIDECLKTKPTFCCKCTQCTPPPTCVCHQEPTCSCTRKLCSYCCPQEPPKCTYNARCSFSPIRQKRCKCKSGRKYSKSPNRENCSCSKRRMKSRHRRRKVKQCDSKSDCEDDCLDYIPMKETRKRSKERDRDCSRERLCEDICTD